MVYNDWVIAVDSTRTIYNKYLNNREFLSVIECINDSGGEILSNLIVIEINILTLWFVNDLNPNVVVTTAEIGFNNDWISLQWIKHIEQSYSS